MHDAACYSSCLHAIALLAALALPQVGPAAADVRPVTPEEFARDLVGKVWEVELPDGQTATERVNADGTVTIEGGIADRGRWRLSTEGYCTRWENMRDGEERCFTVDRTTDGMYRIYKPNGEVSMTILNVRAPR